MTAVGQRTAAPRFGNPARRLRAALLTVAVLVSVLGGRLLQLQAVDAATYADSALSGRLRSVDLPAARGSLLDTHGFPLAASTKARDVVADQTLVEQPRPTAELLAPLLGQHAPDLEKRLIGTRRFVYLAKGVQPETWRQIADLKLPGISSEQVADRLYPAGEVGANVLGFVGADGAGLSGLERSLDDRLGGTPGDATYEVDAGGRRIPLGFSRQTAPTPGRDVQLTLDRDLQWKAQSELAKAVESTGAASGTVVVMDPHTGDLLALATVPTFDPNDPGDAKPEDLGNRAVTEVYEPGSTGKAITAAAALEEGVVRPETPFTVPNRLPRAGKAFADHEDHPTLRLTFTGVIAQSSNIGTILAAERMTEQTLYDYYRRFGIGERTGSGLPGESRGLLTHPSQWSGTSRHTIAFGQGYSVTALQMASVYATIANDGVRMPPRIVRAQADADGRLVEEPLPAGERVVSEQTAREVSLMLEAVTGDGGTAPQTAIRGYRVAGKTGTANRVDPETGRYAGYTASFIGYAPADADAGGAQTGLADAAATGQTARRPGKLVVAVTLQDPKNGYFGGMLAGPVFKAVSSFALRKAAIPPTGLPKPPLRLAVGR